MMDAVKDKAVEIVIAIITIIMSVVLAVYAASHTLKQERKQGELVLQQIGFRYFYNFYRAFDQSTGLLRQDVVSKEIYVEELRSILSVLDGLSANPSYLSRSQKSTSLPLVASEVRAEISQAQYGESFVLRKSSTKLMCSLYFLESASKIELPNQDGNAIDIIKFASGVCDVIE